jgi:hypothetical protein
MLNPSFTLAGTAFREGELGDMWPGSNGYSMVIDYADTCDGNESMFITGVAYTDKNGNGFYDPDEGIEGIMLTAVGDSGNEFHTYTTPSGGYSIKVPLGSYKVFAGHIQIYKIYKLLLASMSIWTL